MNTRNTYSPTDTARYKNRKEADQLTRLDRQLTLTRPTHRLFVIESTGVVYESMALDEHFNIKVNELITGDSFLIKIDDSYYENENALLKAQGIHPSDLPVSGYEDFCYGNKLEYLFRLVKVNIEQYIYEHLCNEAKPIQIDILLDDNEMEFVTEGYMYCCRELRTHPDKAYFTENANTFFVDNAINHLLRISYQSAQKIRLSKLNYNDSANKVLHLSMVFEGFNSFLVSYDVYEVKCTKHVKGSEQ